MWLRGVTVRGAAPPPGNASQHRPSRPQGRRQPPCPSPDALHHHHGRSEAGGPGWEPVLTPPAYDTVTYTSGHRAPRSPAEGLKAQEGVGSGASHRFRCGSNCVPPKKYVT